MANAWVLRKGERVYVFQKETLDGAPRIQILDYHSMQDYHEDAWRDRHSGTSLEYARGFWDKLVENGFTRWQSPIFVTHWDEDFRSLEQIAEDDRKYEEGLDYALEA